MNCPECSSADVDESGTCRVCGFRAAVGAVAESGPEGDRKPYSGAFEVDFSERKQGEPQDIPEWRKELSRRLQEIKQRRQEGTPGDSPAIGDEPPPQPAKPARRPPNSPRRAPLRAAAPPVDKPPYQGEPLPLFRKPEEVPVLRKKQSPEPDGVKALIDQAVGRLQPVPDGKQLATNPVVLTPPAEASPISGRLPARRAETDRLILLTRTLSGLIDLIIVTACTLGVLAATDVVAGLGDVDRISSLVYAVLLVLIFLLYSVFFLGTANQTIGMMITDLRVLGEDGKRPGLRRVVIRSGAYLVSLVAAGVGLLWGCFDAECRCWHDSWSGSRVVRLS